MSDLAVGIMSGTSGDGIDAALIEMRADGTVHPIAQRHRPFTPELRRLVIGVGAGERVTAGEIARLHGALGDAYADEAEALARAAPATPAVVGIHGQTVSHLPGEGVTFQIGDGARVAVRTGIPTVTDFRSADMAAGGQGAPLTPFADHVLFRPRAPCVVVNVGGIANLTLLPDAEPDHVMGFDTGPGNVVIDAIARLGGSDCDTDGAGAKRGRVIEAVLATALAHPFFARAAPKSTGREDFGAPFAERLVAGVRAAGGSLDDALATATELTARTIADAVRGTGTAPVAGASRRRVTWREVLVAGGGAANPSLVAALQRALAPAPVRITDDAGVPAAAREAIAFAILALYRLRGLANTLPRVTGARSAVSGGSVHLPGGKLAMAPGVPSPERMRTPPA